MIKKENDSIVYEKVIPAHGAEYVSFPESMRPEIGDYLRSQGISRLYSHQAEMFVRAGEGESLVITTATASGKTLSFLLPVLQKILENPLTRAIFIYPTKALASDQYRVLYWSILERGVYRQGSMMEIRCLQNAAGSGRVRILF